jgi:hypothetical protein
VAANARRRVVIGPDSKKITIDVKSRLLEGASSISNELMARHVSGTFRRADRINASAGTTVRLVFEERGRETSATLLELGMSDLLLATVAVPALGTRVRVSITLPERYIEVEIPGMVSWHRDGHFGVSFDYLSARQTYALVLAIDLMRSQLDEHPRTKEGSFWHKKVYPWQVWLDGLYMGQPFYIEYAKWAGQTNVFNDVTRQFVTVEHHTRDPKTGLLYHAWDESKEQQWANKVTGQSPNLWGRSIGWFGMALVDIMDQLPKTTRAAKTSPPLSNRWLQVSVNTRIPPQGYGTR